MKGIGTVLVFLSVALAACGTRRGSAPLAEGPAMEEARRLDAALDRLEQRLLASQANVALWEELRSRHENVSAIASRNLGEHARAVALFDEHQLDKRAALKKIRLASRLDPATRARR